MMNEVKLPDFVFFTSMSFIAILGFIAMVKSAYEGYGIVGPIVLVLSLGIAIAIGYYISKNKDW